MAPAHMPQGWQLVYMVVAVAVSASSPRAAQTASFSSGWAEMSPVAEHGVVVFGEYGAVRADEQRAEGCLSAGSRRGGQLRALRRNIVRRRVSLLLLIGGGGIQIGDDGRERLPGRLWPVGSTTTNLVYSRPLPYRGPLRTVS